MLRLAIALSLAPLAADAATCRDTSFEGASYTLCEVTLGEDLRLFHSGPDGAYGSFRNVDAALGAEGKRGVGAGQLRQKQGGWSATARRLDEGKGGVRITPAPQP